MLLFLDGQAHYDSTRIALKYSAVSTINCTWAVTAEGRFGNCLKRAATTNGGPAGYVSVAPLLTRLGGWTPTTSGVIGCAIKIDDVSRVAPDAFFLTENTGLLKIMEGPVWHLLLSLNPDGTFNLYRGGYTLLAVSSEGLNSATWMFVECKWVIDAVAGSVEVRVNGTPVLTYTGRTRENLSGNTLGVWNATRLGGLASTNATPFLVARVCDLYLADLALTAADDVHDFLGDGTIATIFPNGVGSSTGWTASSGANWDTVNDRPLPDDDATYVAALAAGTLDTYQFEDIPVGALVKGAHLNILPRKETEGSSALAPVIHQGSTDYVGPTQGVASVLYTGYLTQPYDLNPATGVKFTAAEINAGQFGVKKVI